VKRMLGLFIVLAVAPVAQAADVEAGKAKAATVCAACHGANGVSVSDAIPNLAAQRAGYLEAQLKALKDGTRKNMVMNAIAAQLSAEDIANVAAHFAAQPGAATGAKSALLPRRNRASPVVALGRVEWAGDPAGALGSAATPASSPLRETRVPRHRAAV